MSQYDGILLAGPTASGKSDLAIALAEKMNGVVVNADSMQVYSQLHLLSARPDADDLKQAPHMLYGHIDGSQQYSTAHWIADVSHAITKVWHSNQLPIITGGTGLYFSSLLKGLSNMPVIKPEMRKEIRGFVASVGPMIAHKTLCIEDPLAAQNIQAHDSQRIARALEVVRSTGKSILSYERPKQSDLIFHGKILRKIILQPERSVLHKHIETRFDAMVNKGALDEVKRLLAENLPPEMTVLKAIGVPQFSSYLRDETSLEQAIETAKIATRQYAKRQSTWFRNQMDATWERVEPGKMC